MNKSEYEEQIVKACKDAGTYRYYFDNVISCLAETLELRDKALQQFEKSGSKIMVKKMTGQGMTSVKNPCLITIDDLTKTALSYWRELGLTPVSLRRISEDAMKPKKKSMLFEALRDL